MSVFGGSTAMEHQQLIPHLFRTEYRKITAVLCKLFGIQHIEIAEDIASETFLAAMETWSYKGVPPNPTAWLYHVAKNKAKNHLTRQTIFNDQVAGNIRETETGISELEIDLSDANITDSQLQMLFTICHPSIAPESQIGLSLRILCGFGIDEIANAFLTGKDVINKRLFRAKEKLRQENVTIELPYPAEIEKRLETVATTLYLLFNEGYYSESKDAVVRKELCLEAMRLTYLLIENEQTSQPFIHALMALMCFYSSRFDARKDENGEMILYQDQDESLWNEELISRGIYFLNKASTGTRLSKYHIEASIAYWHTIKADTREKWESILTLFDQLLYIEYLPIAALNRSYALSKVYGKTMAIAEAEKLELNENRFYFALLGELYKGIDNFKSKMNFHRALALAKTQSDQQIIQKQIDLL